MHRQWSTYDCHRTIIMSFIGLGRFIVGSRSTLSLHICIIYLFKRFRSSRPRTPGHPRPVLGRTCRKGGFHFDQPAATATWMRKSGFGHLGQWWRRFFYGRIKWIVYIVHGIYIYVYRSIHPSIYLSIHPSIHLYIIYIYTVHTHIYI